jgi:catechol-2,3-dioxygenase
MLLAACSRVQRSPRLVGISHVVVRVKDLNPLRQFYGAVLAFQEASTIRKDGKAVAGGGLAQDQVRSVSSR